MYILISALWYTLSPLCAAYDLTFVHFAISQAIGQLEYFTHREWKFDSSNLAK
jgi:hypothetical protein